MLSVLSALAVPPLADARTIKLGWRESDGLGMMSFTVSTLTLGDDRWTVRGSPIPGLRHFSWLTEHAHRLR